MKNQDSFRESHKNFSKDKQNSNILSRRKFVKTTALAAGSLAAFASPVFSGSRAQTDPVAQTRYGKVRGTAHNGINIFKGVRYGADTHPRRFQPALAPDPWTGVKPANEYGPSAPQYGNEGISEDCLFLNIWTPGLKDGGKRPVYFYIHGGGYSGGSGSSPLYDGTNLATEGDAVVVTVNHRLNAFGYLYLGMIGGPDLKYSGNVGQLDLVMALKWVRDNIEEFGGDPQNVTVFGQSGGGAKIATMMAMPDARGLFHRAWTMSGQQVTAAGPRAATQRAGRFLEALDLTENDIDKLMTLDVNKVLEGTRVKDFSRIEDRNLHFAPVFDSVVLPRHPFYPDAPPQSADIPMVIGNTRFETRAFLRNIPDVDNLSWEEIPELIQKNQFVDIRADVVVEEYRKMYPDYSPTEVFYAATTAGRSWRGAVIEAQERAKQPGAGTYVYQLNWYSPLDEGELGASHVMDIPLVFNNTHVYPERLSGNGPRARKMAEVMSQTFIAFAKYGNPDNPAIPEWTPYSIEKRETMIFDDNSRIENDPRGGERKLYRKVPFMQRGTY